MARPFTCSCVHTPNVYSALTLGPFVLPGEVLEVLEPRRKQILSSLEWDFAAGWRARETTNQLTRDNVPSGDGYPGKLRQVRGREPVEGRGSGKTLDKASVDQGDGPHVLFSKG